MSAGWEAFGSVEGGETRERGCPKSREDAPEHKSASYFPLPVGDSNSAFSPLSNAFRTFPMTPCAMRRRGETRRRRGGDEGRGRRERRDGGATRRGCIESSTSSSSRGRRTSCDAYGLNGNRTSYPLIFMCTPAAAAASFSRAHAMIRRRAIGSLAGRDDGRTIWDGRTTTAFVHFSDAPTPLGARVMTTTRPVKSRPARARVGGSRCDGARRKIPSASSAGLPRDRVFDVPP